MEYSGNGRRQSTSHVLFFTSPHNFLLELEFWLEKLEAEVELLAGVEPLALSLPQFVFRQLSGKSFH